MTRTLPMLPAIALVTLPVVSLLFLCTAALHCKAVAARMLYAMLAVMLFVPFTVVATAIGLLWSPTSTIRRAFKMGGVPPPFPPTRTNHLGHDGVCGSNHAPKYPVYVRLDKSTTELQVAADWTERELKAGLAAATGRSLAKYYCVGKGGKPLRRATLRALGVGRGGRIDMWPRLHAGGCSPSKVAPKEAAALAAAQQATAWAKAEAEKAKAEAERAKAEAEKAKAEVERMKAMPAVGTEKKKEAVPTRFMLFRELVAHGRLPRFGSEAGFVHPVTGEPNANLCKPREAFDPGKTCFVFVSHRWLRPGNGPRGHPDDDEQRKYTLIVAALKKLCGGANTPIPEGMQIAVWVDYCCIDQDGAPASELDNLGNLMQACDLMLTPVVDVDHKQWKTPQEQGKTVSNWFDEYLAPGWKEYWSRGWCRVEAMLAAVKPVAAGRAELFRGAMRVHLLGGHRPHVLFGTKELEINGAVIFLPPLLHSKFEQYKPELGALTKDTDRVAVQRLTVEARKGVKKLKVGWVGEYRGEGVGRGKRVFASGGVQEGEFKDGKLHGHGKGVMASGSVYEGQWKEGKRHGKGRYAFADGNIYEGEWEADLRHGKGKYTHASGAVEIGCYEASADVGQGVVWSADRAQAWELQDGQPGRSISQEEAAQIAARIGLPAP